MHRELREPGEADDPGLRFSGYSDGGGGEGTREDFAYLLSHCVQDRLEPLAVAAPRGVEVHERGALATGERQHVGTRHSLRPCPRARRRAQQHQGRQSPTPPPHAGHPPRPPSSPSLKESGRVIH